MNVDENASIKFTSGGKDYFFCSQHCKEKFVLYCTKDKNSCQAYIKRPILKNRLFLVLSISGILLISSLFFDLFAPFRAAFLMYLENIWWAVLLGLLLGGVIDHFIPREYISKVLSRREPSTILKAVSLGFLMSACSHGILALSIQLHKKGASGPAVVSFLMASPWANFAVTMMLLSLFGVKGIFIIIAALIVAINTGLVFMFLEKKGLVEKNANIIEVPEDFSILKDLNSRIKAYKFSIKGAISDFKGVLKGTFALSEMVLWWIILGVLIASLAGAYLPVHFFHRFMGPTLIGLLITLGIATVIEVCSEGSSPLSFEIYRQTGALGNSFVFLMAGVATDYTEIGLLWANVGKRTAIWLIVVSVPQIILLGYLFNTVF
jgi:uncharacterized membrane protein YraQ (UPF0718 family)